MSDIIVQSFNACAQVQYDTMTYQIQGKSISITENTEIDNSTADYDLDDSVADTDPSESDADSVTLDTTVQTIPCGGDEPTDNKSTPNETPHDVPELENNLLPTNDAADHEEVIGPNVEPIKRKR